MSYCYEMGARVRDQQTAREAVLLASRASGPGLLTVLARFDMGRRALPSL